MKPARLTWFQEVMVFGHIWRELSRPLNQSMCLNNEDERQRLYDRLCGAIASGEKAREAR